MTKIPVTLLTGFLGSGKTTVLNTLVRQPAMSGALVVINEFGEIGLDHLLVAHSRIEGVVELSNGCMCCTIRGDLTRTLKDAVWRFSRNGQRQFDRVLIESTGLADPAPILRTLLDDAALAKHYALDGIVTTVDVSNGWRTLDRHPESLRQVAVADVLLLSKTDLADDKENRALTQRLSGINPGARQIDLQKDSLRACDLIDLAVTQSNASRVGVHSWLNASAYAQETLPHTHEHAHGLSAEDCSECSDLNHHHDSHHDDGIRAYSFVLEQPLDPAAFREWREILVAFLGDHLLRFKGIFNIHGESRPLVMHGVQYVLHEPVFLCAWPGEDRSSRLVFIVQNLERRALEQTLEVLGRRVADIRHA